MHRTKLELRCFCSRRPLLAYYGQDEKGEPYLHQKVHKQGRIYGESVFRTGLAEIRCRECYRWTRVRLSMGEQVISPPTDQAPRILGEEQRR